MTQTRTGVGSYVYYLTKHLLKLAPDEKFLGLHTGIRPPSLEALEGQLEYRWLSLPTRALYMAWNVFHAPKVDSLLDGVSVYHATNYFMPPVQSARRVVTVHDLAFYAVPELCSPKIVRPFRKAVRKVVQEADAILACSESTKHDLVNLLQTDPAKVTVALEAVDEKFSPMEPALARRVLKRYGVEPPYLLFVSTLEPRKNVCTLLRAFAAIAKDIPHKLVLVGGVGWRAGTIFRTIDELGIADRIVRPGYVVYEELAAFYSLADAFVFPTLYEGFGLALLEAQTCGCPVVTSNVTSVPEVVGDAAVCVDPYDVDALAGGVRRVIDDEAFRFDLAERGQARARTFSWERCAATTLDVYRRLAECVSS